MRRALTDKSLRALKPKAKRYEVHDLLCPGFSARVSVRGTISFSVKYWYGIKQKRLALGRYPRVSLAKAREKAMDALRQVDEGIDPGSRRRQPSLFAEAVVDEYIRQYARPNNRSWKETDRILKREFVSVYAQRDIRKITRADILEIMDAASERGARYQSNRILANMRKMFNWCIERGIVETNPTNGIRKQHKEVARDRVLDDDEIVRLLRACEQDSYPYKQYVPLLLATAQRRGELANMRWSELDLEKRTWTIPAERSKNGKPHVVPLSDYAIELIDEMPQFVDCDLVFTTTRVSPISSFSKALRRLHAVSGTSDWHLHDLRRTATSGMAGLGIEPHVAEKVLNHISGVISGVAAVYNRHDYMNEKRNALTKWGQFLEALPKSDEVS